MTRKFDKVHSLSHYQAKMKRQVDRDGRISKITRIAAQVAYAREASECDKCGRNDMPTADHVVPASLLRMLGYDVEHEFRLEWLQVLCRPCNLAKGSYIDWTNWRTRPLLTRIIEESYAQHREGNSGRNTPIPDAAWYLSSPEQHGLLLSGIRWPEPVHIVRSEGIS